MEELLIIASASESDSLQGYTLNTGTLLQTWKSAPIKDQNCLSFINQEQFLTIDSTNTITWHSLHKAQYELKTSMPEKISCITVSGDGNFCFAGAVSGNVLCWHLRTGELLNQWEAHYKKLTCLCMSDDESLLISGGEDGSIHCWSISDIFNYSSSHTDSSKRIITPYHTWSVHSLPITSLYCGIGGLNGRLLSTSLDRTCKFLDIPTKSVVCSIVFPTALTSVTMDILEQFLFVGGMNGTIYQLELFKFASISEESLNFVNNFPLQFEGHNQSISKLKVSSDCTLLISSSTDFSCKIWDIKSRQLLRTIQLKGPITNMLLHLYAKDHLTSLSSVNKQGKHKAVPLKKNFGAIEEGNITIATSLQYEELCHLENSQTSAVSLRYKENEVSKGGDKIADKLNQDIKQLTEENQKWKKLVNEIYKQYASEALQANK